jgi:hypothetical protein
MSAALGGEVGRAGGDAMSDSIWDNVAFDHTAAREAASALESAAARLDQASTDRAG